MVLSKYKKILTSPTLAMIIIVLLRLMTATKLAIQFRNNSNNYIHINKRIDNNHLLNLIIFSH